MALELRGKVSLDGSGWESGLAKMATSVKGFIATAFGIYGVQAAIRSTIETVSKLVDTAQRLGIAWDSIQVLEQAAKNAGSSLDAVTTAFEKLRIAKDRALQPGASGAKALEAFGKFGITSDILRSSTAEQLFMGPIAKAVGQMNPEALAVPLKEIFSRSFGEIIPVLQTDFDELGSKMRRFGMIVDAKTAVALDQLSDEFSLLSKTITAKLAPALLTLFETVVRIYAGISASWAWMKEKLTTTATERSAYLTTGLGMADSENAEAQRELRIKKAQDDLLYGSAGPPNTAKEAGLRAFNAVMEPLIELQKKWKEIGEKLEKGYEKKPGELDDLGEAKEKKPRAVKLHKDSGGDALVRVGNFLGSNRGTLENLAMQQVNLLKQIAYNTTPRAGDAAGVSYPS